MLCYGGIILSLFVVLLLNARDVKKGRANIFLSMLLLALAFSIAHILFAGAVGQIPPEIENQLAEGGRIAVVLRPHAGVGRATLITRTGGVLAPRVIFDAGTPLLPGFDAKPGFVF